MSLDASARPIEAAWDAASTVVVEEPRRLGAAASRPALSGVERVGYIALAALWIGIVVEFWRWWLAAAPEATPWLFWPTSAALAYQATLLPSAFWFFVGRMRRPEPRPAPAHARVAMITLCVPADESLEVIGAQLEALRAVEYPHDSWILDEGCSLEVWRLARRLGVRYFSRRHIPEWNAPGPPFQRSTKAGNVNAWLDHIERRGIDYELFVQLDIDHRPVPEYLDKVLGHFDDPAVAWVQAPSVCGNLDRWTARGLAEQDLVLQGPLQMGFYGSSRTPFIIGSHTSYRMAAIREIGGFQPTRAEDHLDTVVLAAHGHRGVYVEEIIAVGDGPEDFATYLRQQFAWAHSMIEVFVKWMPRLVRRYTPAQAAQFLFAQSWYPLWATSLAVLWIVPVLALLTGRPIARVSLGEYLAYSLPMMLGGGLMWCAARRWFKPAGVRLSWRGAVLELARWPVVLWALVNVVLGIRRPYMVTPKGGAGRSGGPRGLMVYGPYLALATLCLLAVVLSGSAGGFAGSTRGYALLTLFDAALAVGLVAITLGLELRDARRAGFRDVMMGRMGIATWTAALIAGIVFGVITAWPALLLAVGMGG